MGGIKWVFEGVKPSFGANLRHRFFQTHPDSTCSRFSTFVIFPFFFITSTTMASFTPAPKQASANSLTPSQAIDTTGKPLTTRRRALETTRARARAGAGASEPFFDIFNGTSFELFLN